MMRIAIEGAGGSGKTALVSALAEHFGVPEVPEFARDLLREWGITSLRELPLHQMVDLQEEILRKKLSRERHLPAFIADRSTADNAVIWASRVSGSVPADVTAAYMSRCRAGFSRYQVLFLLPTDGIPFIDDGIREADSSSRRRFALELEGTIRDWGGVLAVLHSASIADRMAEVWESLSILGLAPGGIRFTL